MKSKKALFLDRDGVINIDYGYVYHQDKFQFVDGIFQFALEFQKRGYAIFVITNQSGIARGYYSEDDFLEVTKYMEEQFRERGVEITKTYHCPCHPKFSDECLCRKPDPYMLVKAKDEFGVDLKESFFIGDKESDMKAGERAGVESYLFLDGGEEKNSFEYILEKTLGIRTK
jgi:D-glycero-D-manno-heptose 1,7-bisphosphate phosphatase